jgi:hypothetical protein
MRDKADGAHLLKLARQTLLEQILDELSADKRYLLRLAANAIAIAERELQAGQAPGKLERTILEDLVEDFREESEILGATETSDEALQRLRWRLAAEIRAGHHDGKPKVHAGLDRIANAYLAIVNPRAVNPGAAKASGG